MSVVVELPPAWIPKRRRIDHPERKRMRESPARIKWLCGSRRSGKSTDGLDYLLLGHGPRDDRGNPMFRGALNPPAHVLDPTFVCAAPTREMVKRLWWGRIKQRIPIDFIERINETELTIYLHNGARIICLGMDRPTRGEGFAIDGMVGDEFAYWKALAFEQSLRPALSTRGRPPGWAILMGKPAGRNHFFESWTKAKEGTVPGHDAFHWPSSVVIDPAELAAARDELDQRSYQQEYEASFLTQTGLVYYQWDSVVHCRPVVYDPNRPLVFCLDFNVSPGSAVVVQEQDLPPLNDPNGKTVPTTCIIDEVYKQDSSNTPWVCAQLVQRYHGHKGDVMVYGDVGGHQRRTQAKSTDWEIVREELAKGFANVTVRVPRQAPAVIDSVNCVNARLMSSTGTVRVALNEKKCIETRRDFEGVVWDEKRGDRQIDKDDPRRTHWADAFRYYCAAAFPIRGTTTAIY